jgi:hypothetical protein
MIHTFGGPKVLQWGGVIQEDPEMLKRDPGGSKMLKN